MLTERLPDVANRLHPWQGDFRVGALDEVLLRYALEICADPPEGMVSGVETGAVQGLLLSGLDRLAGWSEVPWVTSWGATPPPRVLSRLGLEPSVLLESRVKQARAAQAAVGEVEQLPGWSEDALPAKGLPPDSPDVRVGPVLMRWLERLVDRLGVPVRGLGWGESSLDRALMR